MNQSLLKKLEFLWGIPIFQLNEESREIKSFGTFSEKENPLASSKELVELLTTKASLCEVPVIYKSLGKIYFICIHSNHIYYLSGPVSVEQLNYVEIHRFYKKYRISIHDERHPVKMNLTKLLSFVSFLYEFLENKDIKIEELMQANDLTDQTKPTEELNLIETSLDEKEKTAFHHTYLEERYVMDAVREGNIDVVNERATALFEKAGILSKNKFNDQRNLAIVATTVATREAIAGGVSPADAYKLSDLLINKIDSCTQLEDVVELTRKSLYKFTRMVIDAKNKTNLSNYTEQCKDYISQNYHHKIYLDDIAGAIGISRGHLERIFKNDTGLKIQDYILKFRIERAANLLKYSDATISEISDYVCFNSQSHFGKVFKQYMEETPKQYREKYKQKEFY